MSEIQRADAPHCDASTLHAPGVCIYCDEFGDWQELRQLWSINFTGQMLDGRTPCPSQWFRDPLIRDLWGGNQVREA